MVLGVTGSQGRSLHLDHGSAWLLDCVHCLVLQDHSKELSSDCVHCVVPGVTGSLKRSVYQDHGDA